MKLIFPEGEIKSGKMNVQWCLSGDESRYVEDVLEDEESAKPHVLLIVRNSTGKEKRYVYPLFDYVGEIAFFSKGDNSILIALLPRLSDKKHCDLIGKIFEANSEFGFYSPAIPRGVSPGM